MFRDEIESFLDPEIVKACAVLSGSMAFQKYTFYQAFSDPGGSRVDAFNLSIGHFNYDKGKYQIDFLKAWQPPFNPSEVVKEISDILSDHRITRCQIKI